MKRFILPFLMLLAMSPGADAGWRVGNQLILEGDSKARVLEIAGAPDYRETLENRYGAAVGVRWYYRETGYNKRTIIIRFASGRVVEIRIERR